MQIAHKYLRKSRLVYKLMILVACTPFFNLSLTSEIYNYKRCLDCSSGINCTTDFFAKHSLIHTFCERVKI